MLLAPYRVLDISDERGQLAGQMLAQLGADVIAVEPPEGSRSRRLAPFAGERQGPDDSLVHRAYNRGKRSVVLDLGSGETDRARLVALLSGSDVLVESGGPHYLDSIGFSSEALAEINPALVILSISPFGASGPKAHWAATDMIVWAASGAQALAGDVDRPPVPVGVPQAFVHACAEGVGAVIVALLERGRSGLGQHLDVSAQQAAAQATQCSILATPNNASTHFRMSGGLKLANLFLQLVWPCKDGYVSITFLFGSAIGVFSTRFMKWIHEEGFCDEATRDKDWIGYTDLLLSGKEPVSEYERVKDVIADLCLSKTKAELLEGALARGLLITPILGVDDVVDSDHLAFRDYFDDVDGVRYPGQFGVLSKTPRVRLGAPPSLGAHTDSVFAEPARKPALSSTAAGSPGGPRGRALEGLKVLDLMWVMAGPAGSRVLADHGATVVRVESSTRVETARTLQPFRDNVSGAERSALFASLNAGKKGVALDLSRPEGQEVVLDLVRWADVVLESFSPRAMRNWGLDYEKLRSVNPTIVMMSSCLFGQTGPLAMMAGYGTMASALTGFTGITGWHDRAPCGPYGAYTDYIAPRFANAVLLAAIDHQRRTGEGQYIDFAQAEGALHALAPAILDYTVNGRSFARAGTVDPNLRPHGVYRTKGDSDSDWIAIACENGAQRANLASFTGGLDDTHLGAWAATRNAVDAMIELQSVGVPAHQVQNSPECIIDPQLIHRGHFVELPHSEMGTVAIESSRVRFSATPATVTAPGPSMGEHTHEVLTDILGYSEERFVELLIGGVLE